MKEFIEALKWTIICQLLCWGFFILCDEKYISQSSSVEFALNSGVIILIILFFIYFVEHNFYINNVWIIQFS